MIHRCLRPTISTLPTRRAHHCIPVGSSPTSGLQEVYLSLAYVLPRGTRPHRWTRHSKVIDQQEGHRSTFEGVRAARRRTYHSVGEPSLPCPSLMTLGIRVARQRQTSFPPSVIIHLTTKTYQQPTPCIPLPPLPITRTKSTGKWCISLLNTGADKFPTDQLLTSQKRGKCRCNHVCRMLTDFSRSMSTHCLPAASSPTPRPESSPTDAEPRSQRSQPKKPRPTTVPRVSRRAVAQGPGYRDHLPEPGEVNVIECGWTGCKTPIQHDIRSIRDHIRFHHGALFKDKEPLTCRWVRGDTEECGSKLLPESLCRHTLDVHTNLIMKDCVCGKRFRRDTLGRHRCEAQGNL